MHGLPSGCFDVFLNPGEYYFGDRQTRMRTLLGSCVAITLWHRVRRVGGMCHYVLPERGERDVSAPNGRYGAEAIAALLREVPEHGTRIEDYEFKLFGGGQMFNVADTAAALIGERNVTFARGQLERIGARVVAEHSGGSGYRSLVFDVWSGDVWMRYQEGKRETEARIRPGNRLCRKKSLS
ncbi:MAG: chemotaxis protein CheD [Gammaproteobacteria bacterium]|jgi:chemotaxis protein CheD|nr:chemotaxis protein CheD [Gammaproteobacteria bacterium]MBU0772020.1 chemotaxis protein CheD [Gammaproteobacteria bacterium]MBU0856431.1 chemotaxis protein CheD [Gammaproteobacteria bacterium]MBU1845812.1 chemotaxis protein CheD [Gammaproteobacteria bacterium]